MRALLFAIFLLLFTFVLHVGLPVLCAFVATYIVEPAVQEKLT